MAFVRLRSMGLGRRLGLVHTVGRSGRLMGFLRTVGQGARVLRVPTLRHFDRRPVPDPDGCTERRHEAIARMGQKAHQEKRRGQAA